MWVILIICEWEKYPLADIRELQSSMFSQTFGKNLQVVSPVCYWKNILLAKLCEWTKKLTSSPDVPQIFWFLLCWDIKVKSENSKLKHRQVLQTFGLKVPDSWNRRIRLMCLHPCCHPIQITWWFIWEDTIVQFATRNCVHEGTCKQNNCTLPNESSHDLNWVATRM